MTTRTRPGTAGRSVRTARSATRFSDPAACGFFPTARRSPQPSRSGSRESARHSSVSVSTIAGIRVAALMVGPGDSAGFPTAVLQDLMHMTRPSDGFPARTLIAAIAFVWSATIGVAAAGGREHDAQANGFVGEETCVTCHETEGKRLRTTRHGSAQNVRTPAGAPGGQSCEVCHGPGQKHADSLKKEDIRRFGAVAARDA